MPKMVSKNPIKKRREERRLAKLQKGQLVNGVEVPKNALAAEPDAQNHQGGYSVKFYYQDIPYKCAGCGRPGVWTAQQQKRYFEKQKGNIYNEPKWCYECHSMRMRKKVTEHAGSASRKQAVAPDAKRRSSEANSGG